MVENRGVNTGGSKAISVVVVGRLVAVVGLIRVVEVVVGGGS